MLPAYVAAVIPALVLAAMLGPLRAISLATCFRPPMWFALTIVIHTAMHFPSPSISGVALFLFAPVVAMALVEYSAINLQRLLSAVRWVIALNVAALVFQATYYFFASDLLNLHTALIPFSGGRHSTLFYGVVRFGGFQIEPGTYANVVSMLVATSRCLAGRFGRVEYIAVVSIMGVFSGAGFAFIAVLGAWIFVDHMSPSKLKFGNIVRLLLFVIAIGIFANMLGVREYYMDRFFYAVDDSVLIRRWALEAWGALDPVVKLLGMGFPTILCEICAFEELGLGVNAVMRGGIFIVIAILIWIVSTILTGTVPLRNLFFCMTIVTFVKINIYWVLPWLPLFAIYAQSNLRLLRRENVH